MTKAFNIIFDKARELKKDGYLQAFVQDLIHHDRRTIDKYGDTVEFVWMIGEAETHIVMKPDFVSEKETNKSRNSWISAYEDFFNPKHYSKAKVFYYNGNGSLSEVKNAEELEVIFNSWKSF